MSAYETGFTTFNVYCKECGCRVDFLGWHILNKDSITCPVCKRDLGTEKLKRIVISAAQIEACMSVLSKENIHVTISDEWNPSIHNETNDHLPNEERLASGDDTSFDFFPSEKD